MIGLMILQQFANLMEEVLDEADDSVVMSLRLFQEGYISISELVNRLEYKELSTQYFFHNECALNY